MKRLLLLGFFVGSSASLFAQNKTLGVGIATPNPNAALHVESPTGNQGFILPRLTTAQRTAIGFISILGQPDNGLMVYDTDLNTIFIWNGETWQTTGQVSGGGYYEINDPQSTATTLIARTNSDAGGPLPPVAIYGETTGAGSSAGSFRIKNATNPNSALYAETLGTGIAVMGVTSTGYSAVMGQVNAGISHGVSGISNSSDPGSFAVMGSNNGGGSAGGFNISGNTNASNALVARTEGTGSAGFFEQSGLTASTPAVYIRTDGQNAALNATSSDKTANANAAEFIVQNAGNPRNAVWATTQGVGSAGMFENFNIANTSAAIFAKTIGTGAAVSGENAGAGNGFAGLFNNSNASNPYPAIQASTIGTGPGLRVMQDVGSGSGIDIHLLNGASTAPGLSIDQRGTGVAGSFAVNNATNPNAAVYATSSGTGAALAVEQANNGLAIDMASGGLKYSVMQVNTAPIVGIAGIYKINVVDNFALPTLNVQEGTFCKVFNAATEDIALDPVFVQGTQAIVVVPRGTIADFIFINGAWYQNP